MTKTPSAQQLATAILWLEANEGDNGESEACAVVAAYLNEKVAVKQREVEAVRQIVAEAKRQGVPVTAKSARTWYRRSQQGEG